MISVKWLHHIEAVSEPFTGYQQAAAYHYRSWSATPGDHEVPCRATDADGDVQPLDMPWNYQGMGNNAVQVVEVTVRAV